MAKLMEYGAVRATQPAGRPRLALRTRRTAPRDEARPPPTKRQLVTTPQGRKRLTDPPKLLIALATELLAGDSFRAACAELTVALILDGTVASYSDALADRIHPAILAEGWQAAGERPDLRNVLWTISDFQRPAEAIGILERRESSSRLKPRPSHPHARRARRTHRRPRRPRIGAGNRTILSILAPAALPDSARGHVQGPARPYDPHRPRASFAGPRTRRNSNHRGRRQELGRATPRVNARKATGSRRTLLGDRGAQPDCSGAGESRRSARPARCCSRRQGQRPAPSATRVSAAGLPRDLHVVVRRSPASPQAQYCSGGSTSAAPPTPETSEIVPEQHRFPRRSSLPLSRLRPLAGHRAGG